MIGWLIVAIGVAAAAHGRKQQAQRDARLRIDKAARAVEAGAMTMKVYDREVRRALRVLKREERSWSALQVVASFGTSWAISHLLWRHAPLWASAAWHSVGAPVTATVISGAGAPAAGAAFGYGAYPGMVSGTYAYAQDVLRAMEEVGAWNYYWQYGQGLLHTGGGYYSLINALRRAW